MGIWNRRKRGGSPDSPGMETFPDSPGLEAFPDSPGMEAFPDSPGVGTLPHSIGIETMGGNFTPLISQGMPLPASVTEIFTTGERNQPSITIRCFQGEESRTAGNMELGLFELTEIPPGGRGEPQIEVTFHVDASGAFSITARDARTGRDLPVWQC
jgi:molecular chaperone DnaK (HSP70)